MQTPTADTAASQIASASSTGRIVTGIREAASATGVSFDYLLSQAARESGLDPQARNTRSSAAGLFQFTSQTWLDMVRRHGAKHGLGEQAAAITRGANGRLDIADKAVKAAVLDLRKDPELSAMMAAEYARDNSKILERKLGRPATASDLHLAHFLGAGGAVRVIEGMASDPDNSAHSLLPEAARANPELFRDPGSREARTVTSLYNSVQARHQGGSNGRADLAALRPEPRPDLEAEQAVAQQVAVQSAAVADPAVTLVATDARPAAEPSSAAVTVALSDGGGFRAAIPTVATARVEVRSMKDIVAAIRAGQDV
ncbi:transglycosylase SLT domain-containing protein [Magnetospirillum fulvum]|uniref:Transglycosylase SLT domain-containing protein n=1 Tax=Magnetospirillum fulvum TaxID=1082 RepID=A0A1H6JWZ0_MAGFU|nr:transglycosylase SLT domain-containing protein [Magnetospirillum fulvum]SEH63803.1 Transglycosylase SLT domain-containing protein [Magnetospirillum fulvum]